MCVFDDWLVVGFGVLGLLLWEDVCDWFYVVGNYVDMFDCCVEEIGEMLGVDWIVVLEVWLVVRGVVVVIFGVLVVFL